MRKWDVKPFRLYWRAFIPSGKHGKEAVHLRKKTWGTQRKIHKSCNRSRSMLYDLSYTSRPMATKHLEILTNWKRTDIPGSSRLSFWPFIIHSARYFAVYLLGYSSLLTATQLFFFFPSFQVSGMASNDRTYPSVASYSFIADHMDRNRDVR